MRDPIFDCAPHLCESASTGASGDWGFPFWVAVLLIILVSLLIVSFVQPKKDPPTLKKAVDDVLEGYEKQARVWGDNEAETAFRNARTDVGKVVDKYRSPPFVGP